MKNKLINDNKGFSLVELIVVVLITGILMLAIMTFLSSSRSMYQTVSTSATLQEESLTAERVISEYLMEASDYSFANKNVSVGSAMTDIFWIKAKENEETSDDPDKQYSIYYFVLDKTSGKLKYYKDKYNENHLIDASGNVVNTTKLNAECFGTKEKYSVIANYIKSISVSTIERADRKNLICMTITYNYAGKDFVSNITAVTRNEKDKEAVETPPEDPETP